MNSSGTLKIARNGYIVIAVVFCALGIFLMAVPEKAVAGNLQPRLFINPVPPVGLEPTLYRF